MWGRGGCGGLAAWWLCAVSDLPGTLEVLFGRERSGGKKGGLRWLGLRRGLVQDAPHIPSHTHLNLATACALLPVLHQVLTTGFSETQMLRQAGGIPAI